MEAAAPSAGVQAVTAPSLRALVGAEVAVRTASEQLQGTLLSCTDRSLWIVAGDVDHLVAMPRVLSVTAR